MIIEDRMNTNMKNQSSFFKIPIYLVALQYFVNFLVTLLLLIFPIIIFIFIFLIFQDRLKDFFIIGLLISGLFSILIIIFLFETFYEPKIKEYKKLKEYFFRRWIVRNIKCPECHGLINKYEKRYKNPEFIFEYFYHCNSCRRKFYLEPLKKSGGWKISEFKKK